MAAHPCAARRLFLNNLLSGRSLEAVNIIMIIKEARGHALQQSLSHYYHNDLHGVDARYRNRGHYGEDQ